MIIESLNIRGCGNKVNRKRVSQEIIAGKADIFLIQESKLQHADKSIARSLWGIEKVGWSYSKYEGQSGG